MELAESYFFYKYSLTLGILIIYIYLAPPTHTHTISIHRNCQIQLGGTSADLPQCPAQILYLLGAKN